MALALHDAGMDTIIFDGPGQGVTLDDGITMTPDWRLPVAAIADHFALNDFTLLGFSLAALWSCALPRANRGSAA